VRGAMPAEMLLFVRISATDWAPDPVKNGWDLDQSIQLARWLKLIGVDLIDASSGGTLPRVSIPVAPGYQVPFARRIRKEANIATAAVGMITEPQQANEIIQQDEADLVFLAREMLREPYWAVKAERELGQAPILPVQYERSRQ
jgi:2,4-dienoyl-CoA reductase-like NADH-dependent reductase (Old Yellow Enzyme family)